MADQTYDQLLTSLGFDGNIAGNIDRINRRKDLAVSDVGLAGEQERQQINDNAESRGMFQSGRRHADIATQYGQEASRVSQIEAAAADDIASEQQAVVQAQAAAQAQQQALAQQQQMFNAQLSAQQQQLALDQQYRDQELALSTPQAPGSGYDAALLQQILDGLAPPPKKKTLWNFWD